MTPNTPLPPDPADDDAGHTAAQAAQDALETIARVGRHEEHLSEERIAAIAGAAARQRKRTRDGTAGPFTEHDFDRLLGVSPNGGRVAVDGDEPGPAAVIDIGRRNPTPRPRWSLIGTAAAVLVVVGIGVDVLADRGEVVEFQDGSRIEPSITDETVGSEPVDSTVFVVDVDDPVVDERNDNDPAETTTSAPAPSTGSSESDPAADQATEATPTPPATAEPPTTASTAPQTSTGSGDVDDQPAAEGARARSTIAIGDAGSVGLAIDANRPSADQVTTGTGWTHSIASSAEQSLAVSFTADTSSAALEVRSDDSGFVLDVDRGDAQPRSSTMIRTLDFSQAGVVRVTYDAYGLKSLDVEPGSGWSHLVNTPETDHIDIRLVGPPNVSSASYILDIGALRLTMQAGT